jgi:hypothetical protein
VETGTRLPTSEPAFHADDTLQVAEYRTVSALAIVSLMFGLASPLCFAWPLLMAIPLIGAVISIIALVRIDASEGALAGRWAATAGLALCVVSGTAAVSRDLVTRYVRTRQAEELAREWIELLLAGNTEDAFRLTVAGNRRQSPMPEPGMPPPTATPYELFLDDPVVSALVAAGTDSKIRSVKVLAYDPQPHRQYFVQQKFLIAPPASADAARQPPIEVVLTLQRSQLGGERQPRWLVVSHEAPQATDEAAHVH